MRSKNIIDYIKKMGQEADVPMFVPKGGPRVKSEVADKPKSVNKALKPSTPSSNHSYISASAVKTMQEAILEVADIASKTDLTSFDGANTDQQTGAQGENLDGSNPFGQFLVDNFIAPKGNASTFVNTDVPGQTARMENKIQGGTLRGIINSIKRIGTPGVKGGEVSADGVWKGRTQDSLKNLYLLVSGYLDFANALKLPVQGYTLGNLAQLNGLINSGYPKLKTTQEANNLAANITKHLNALKVFFTNFNKEVVNHPTLKNQINQKKSFSKYKTVPMKNEVPEGYDLDHVKLNLPNMKRQLRLSDLEDIQHFTNWMKDNGHKTDEATLRQMLKVIKDQLG